MLQDLCLTLLGVSGSLLVFFGVPSVVVTRTAGMGSLPHIVLTALSMAFAVIAVVFFSVRMGDWLGRRVETPQVFETTPERTDPEEITTPYAH